MPFTFIISDTCVISNLNTCWQIWSHQLISLPFSLSTMFSSYIQYLGLQFQNFLNLVLKMVDVPEYFHIYTNSQYTFTFLDLSLFIFEITRVGPQKDWFKWTVVMCQLRLGLKALAQAQLLGAQAQLLGAQALENDRPGLKPKIRLGLAWLWPKPGPGTYITAILCSPQCKIQISM